MRSRRFALYALLGSIATSALFGIYAIVAAGMDELGIKMVVTSIVFAAASAVVLGLVFAPPLYAGTPDDTAERYRPMMVADIDQCFAGAKKLNERIAAQDVAGAQKAGFSVVLNEGYSATAPDLSALVTKLKRARPDVIFHTGYNPDITLLLRQAREQGLKVGAIVGHGAGYGVYDKLKEGLGPDANYLFDTDPISIWLTNTKTLDPKLLPVIKMIGTFGCTSRSRLNASYPSRSGKRMSTSAAE